MDRKSKDGMPRYQQIALDIATQIVKQQYKVGDRIYARSSLASKYHVSPETARRAICLLADMDIVEAEKGSGVVILSVDNAARYLQQLTGVETMTSLRQSIRQDLDNQLLLAQQLREKHLSAFLAFPLAKLPAPGQILLTDGALPFGMEYPTCALPS